MCTYEISPQEVDSKTYVSEQEKERAALEALIDYTIQCAGETQLLSAGESMEAAKQYLSRSIFL